MIPVCEVLFLKNEEQYVMDCLKTRWISSGGKYIKLFEAGFSQYCGKKYGISMTSGTAALHVAVRSLNISKGDEIIMPSFAIASTAFSAIYCGAKPVLADSQRDTWNMNTDQIASKITKKTKAIMVVHTYGHPCDMDPIMRIAKKHRLKIIEDAAEAHGAEYHGQKTGSFGDISCFSFYGNKIITCGEGGMILTDSESTAKKCSQLRNLAFGEKVRFKHSDIGFNYRMTNIQAALGLAQLESIEQFVANRRSTAHLYNQLLKDVPGLTLPVEKENVKNVYWVYGLLVEKNFGMSRDALMKKLYENGVETRAFFYPLNRQPVLRKMGLFSRERYPVAEEIGQRGFYLPSGSGLKKEEIELVCSTLRKIQKEAK